jgi:hypothetical protein
MTLSNHRDRKTVGIRKFAALTAIAAAAALNESLAERRPMVRSAGYPDAQAPGCITVSSLGGRGRRARYSLTGDGK